MHIWYIILMTIKFINHVQHYKIHKSYNDLGCRAWTTLTMVISL